MHLNYYIKEYYNNFISGLSAVVVILGLVNNYYEKDIKQLDDATNILTLIFLALQSGLNMNLSKSYKKLRNSSISSNMSNNPFPSPPSNNPIDI